MSPEEAKAYGLIDAVYYPPSVAAAKALADAQALAAEPAAPAEPPTPADRSGKAGKGKGGSDEPSGA
jgi:enoyl-CoA hydratase/carnithine racemase